MKSSISKEIFVPLALNVNEPSFSSPCIISSGFVLEKISNYVPRFCFAFGPMVFRLSSIFGVTGTPDFFISSISAIPS